MAVKLFLVEFRFYLFPLRTVFSFIAKFSLVASSKGGGGGWGGGFTLWGSVELNQNKWNQIGP